MTWTVAGHELDAISVGGLETCIGLPEWKLCFDIGRCPPSAVRLPRVLVTHAHTDHLGGIVHHCSTRDLMGMSPPTYFLPEKNVEAFHELLAAWRKLDRSELPCTVVGVKPGDVLDLGAGRVAHVFQAYHRVTAVGYALSHRKSVLRPELVGLPREALIRRREAGEDLRAWVETVEVAFCGDTTIEVVEREAAVRTARLLILEVTFVDDRVPVAKARGQGHIHLDEVLERADLFENEVLLMTHLSARYSTGEARRILDRRLPERLKERVRLLPRPPPWGTDVIPGS